jgi:hypothetical protein
LIVNVIPCHQNCQKGSSLTAKNVITVIEIIMISNVGDNIAELTSEVVAINPHGIEPPGVPHAHHP